jgi:hypothetical protein
MPVSGSMSNTMKNLFFLCVRKAREGERKNKLLSFGKQAGAQEILFFLVCG